MEELAKKMRAWMNPPYAINAGTDKDPTWFLPEQYLETKKEPPKEDA